MCVCAGSLAHTAVLGIAILTERGLCAIFAPVRCWDGDGERARARASAARFRAVAPVTIVALAVNGFVSEGKNRREWGGRTRCTAVSRCFSKTCEDLWSEKTQKNVGDKERFLTTRPFRTAFLDALAIIQLFNGTFLFLFENIVWLVLFG